MTIGDVIALAFWALTGTAVALKLRAQLRDDRARELESVHEFDRFRRALAPHDEVPTA